MPNFNVLIWLFLVKSDYIFNFPPKVYFILLLCYQFFTILYTVNGMGRGLEIIFLRNIKSIVFNDNIPIVDCPIDF